MWKIMQYGRNMGGWDGGNKVRKEGRNKGRKIKRPDKFFPMQNTGYINHPKGRSHIQE